MNANKEALEGSLDMIPVAVNDCYGDPLFPAQLDDTVKKLKSLAGRAGPSVVITKGIIKGEAAKRLGDSLSTNTAILYSITGLNEGRIRLNERVDTLRSLRDVTQNMVILVRPVIPGKNDRFETLAHLTDIACEFTDKIVYGGYKPPEGSKSLPILADLERKVKTYAREQGLSVFEKSACALSDLLDLPCYAHLNEEFPRAVGVQVLRRLGYDFRVEGRNILMREGTKGDVNFFRFLAGKNPVLERTTPTNQLSFSRGTEKIFEATSSYFIWARGLTQCYGCDYCILDNPGFEPPRIKEVGCNPRELINGYFVKQ